MVKVGQGGYHFQYREEGPNRCPGCGRDQWWIGSATAECAFCQTALELERSVIVGSNTIFRRGKRK